MSAYTARYPLAVAIAISALLNGCSYTAQPKAQLPSYHQSSDCSKKWDRVKGVAKYWHPSSGATGAYIMYKNHLFHAWEVIGDIHYSGCPAAGVTQNKNMAMGWYQSAAGIHLASSQFKLGRMIYEGDGVVKNPDLAMKWLFSAAIEGSHEARSYLAALGVAAPPAIAPTSYEVYQEAARQNLINANAEERARIMQDLGRIAAASAQALVGLAAATAAAYSIQPQQTYIYLDRRQPVYCSAFISETGAGNTTFASVQAFCR